MKIVNLNDYRFGPLKENSVLDGYAMMNAILSVLTERGEVKVTGLGIFKVVKCKPLGKKILNGKTYNVGKYNKIRFRPTVGLRDAIQSYGEN